MQFVSVLAPAKRAVLVILSLLAAGLAAWAAGGVTAALTGLAAGPTGVGLGIIAGLLMLPFWIVGVCLVGGPLWLALHMNGRRDRNTALIFGGLAGAFGAPAVLIVMMGLGGAPVDPAVLLLAPPAAIGGALAGYAIWRLGYEGERA